MALEARRGAADLAAELVQRAGWPVALAHAGYVARIKQGPDKTDFSDARLLANRWVRWLYYRMVQAA